MTKPLPSLPPVIWTLYPVRPKIAPSITSPIAFPINAFASASFTSIW